MLWYVKTPEAEAIGPLTGENVARRIKLGLIPPGSLIREDQPGSLWAPLQSSPLSSAGTNEASVGRTILGGLFGAAVVFLTVVSVLECSKNQDKKTKTAVAKQETERENERAIMVKNLRGSEGVFKERQYARCKENTLEVPVFLPQCRDAVDICFRKSLRGLEEGGSAGEAYEACFFPTLTRLINSSSESSK